MSSVQDNNSQEVLNQTYSSKDFVKDAIELWNDPEKVDRFLLS